MKKHYDIRVSGIVQGVFFRASAKEKADLLKISGLVRNESDGSVFIEAEGDHENLMAYIAWCHHGPPQAVVENCEVKEGTMKDHGGFSVVR